MQHYPFHKVMNMEFDVFHVLFDSFNVPVRLWKNSKNKEKLCPNFKNGSTFTFNFQMVCQSIKCCCFKKNIFFYQVEYLQLATY